MSRHVQPPTPPHPNPTQLALLIISGVPSTVVIAASFDDIVAITGFSIFVNLAIAGGDNAAWQIASGPLQVRRLWLLQPAGMSHDRHSDILAVCPNSLID
jgi:hypothetical protein